jgi:hypothetical protein
MGINQYLPGKKRHSTSRQDEFECKYQRDSVPSISFLAKWHYKWSSDDDEGGDYTTAQEPWIICTMALLPISVPQSSTLSAVETQPELLI